MPANARIVGLNSKCMLTYGDDDAEVVIEAQDQSLLYPDHQIVVLSYDGEHYMPFGCVTGLMVVVYELEQELVKNVE